MQILTEHDSRIIPVLVFSCLVVLLSVGASPVSAEVIGLSGRYNDLIQLFLSSSDGDVADGESWTAAGLGLIHAVEWDGGDRAYVVAGLPISASGLFSVNLQTEEVTLLASVSLVGPFHLSFADDGILWMSRSDQLFSYNPESEVLTLETTIAVDDSLGLAWWDDTLHILTPGVDPFDAPMLGELDPTDGTVSGLSELSAVVPSGPFFRFFSSIDFDRDGGLWIGFVESNGIADPPFQYGGTAYIADPFGSGDAVVRELADGRYWPLNPMAVVGGFDVVEVPTLSGRELSVFAIVLGLLAIVAVRRGRVV